MTVKVPGGVDLPSRLLLETTALSRPGRERGLGRYTRACLEGAQALGLSVTELCVRPRGHRAAEFSDLVERGVTALVHKRDIFHITNPLAWGPSTSPTVASILDLIPMDMPGYKQTGIKTNFFYSRATRARVIMTISNFTAERIVDRFRVAPERVIVAPLFPRPAFRLAAKAGLRPRLPDNHVISLVDMATPDTRKRADWIAPLSRDLKQAGLGLVLVGAGTERCSPTAMGEAIGLGRVEDDELARLMRNATCFLYFSAYEGQGLPPLEAMAAGAAVVCTANTAVAEIVGDGGILVTERAGHWSAALREDEKAKTTRKDLVDACVAIKENESLRSDLQLQGQTRAARFSEACFNGRLAEAYRLAACASR